MAGACQIYNRKLDRSPEKEDFFRLPKHDQVMVAHFRTAVESVHKKMTKLQDEICDKEHDMNREVSIRKVLESKLSQVVDMYVDPAVTEELRCRLPRSDKTDPRKHWQEQLDNVKMQLDTENALKFSKLEEGSKIQLNNTNNHTACNKAGTGRTRRRMRGRRECTDGESDDVSGASGSHSPPSSRRREHLEYPASFPAYPASPYQGYVPAIYPFPTSPLLYAPSIQGAATPDDPTTMRQGAPPNAFPSTVQHANTFPRYKNVTFSEANHYGAGHVTPMFSHNSMPGASMNGSYISNSDNGGLTVDHTSPDHEGLTAGSFSQSTPNLHTSNVKDANVSREQNRQISLLLAELDAAKDLNKKLQKKLDETEHELETLRLARHTRDAELEADTAGKAAALVEDIYRAQKERDSAMIGRLRLANEERDVALLKLKHLKTSGDIEEEIDEQHAGHVNLKELLAEIDQSDNPSDVLKRGGQIVQAITTRQERKRQITTEEMRAILEERDNTMAKCKSLESQLLRQQRLERARGSDKQQYADLQARLLATQQERDLAQTRVRKQEDELQTLRVYYSLHKSLSQEEKMRDQFNNTLDSIEGQLRQRDSHVDRTQKENNRILSQLRAAMQDNKQLQADLQKSQQQQKETQTNCEKLERLVNVLRRKINGLGSKTDD